MFKPDQPIKSYKEDILGRYPFAKSLGDAILSYKEKDSIVIGLFGTWGSGKTSIINMALEYIENISKDKADDEKPIIMRFNPWNYSDQNQLISQFFIRLSGVLRRRDYTSKVNKAGELLEIYAKILESFILIPNISPIASVFSKLFRNIGSTAKNLSRLNSKDLNAVRSELNELLSDQPHKIVIVIDDIDRLNDTEIRQIFQLVKSLGDFPNTIYLLAFDRAVVINALESVQKGFGIEYLEKIVQIPFEIPLISKQEVEYLLLNQLNELIRNIPENKWNKAYWENIYYSGLRYFFKNIRDVTRYINSLRFSFEMVKEDVNPIDFFAITGIQVFIPEVYYSIRDNKNIFSGIYSNFRTSDERKKQDREICDGIIGKVKDPSPEVLRNFLKKLFPKVESIYDNIEYGPEELSDWRRERRICSPDVFDTFFKLSLSPGEISQKEIETILSLGNKPELFSEALLRLNDEGKIIEFLEYLKDYTRSEIPEENVEPIITVLMDIGDMFPENDSNFLGIDTTMRLGSLFHQLIRRFDSQEKRFNILKHAMEKATKSLYTIVYEVGFQDQEHSKYDSKETSGTEEKLIINLEQLEELKKIACKKIESWANDGRLAKQKYLYFILFMWKKWGQEGEVNSFVDNMIKDDEGLIDFITSFLEKTQSFSTSDYVIKTNWRIDLQKIKEFVNLEEVEARIRKIFSSSDFEQLDDQKKLAVKIFLDTVDGKIEKPF
ncbi:MAG TPA: P-loop NTPase fold protein [Dictyoglomaceae bacterium]|nr:P-loop NTPase fold protein [Caldisericia bacterium]HPU44406.1 P-loop NTPase fold protein [Dictyoglomaceae bacterium]